MPGSLKLSWGMLLGIWLLLVGPLQAETPLKVVFLNPGISDPNDPTGKFWLSVSAFMQAAAEDLKIQLEILYAERNHILMKQQAKELTQRASKPDFLIVVNEKQAADEMVEVANQAGIKVFVLLNSFVGEQAAAMGEPRTKYPHWIGSLVPDNRWAGYQTAKLMIAQALEAKATAKDGKLHLLAIGGDRATPASQERNAGLEAAVAESPQVELKQLVFGEWNRDKASEITQTALDRYPEIGAIWAANDPMALGALATVKSAQKQPGKTIFLSGLNWDDPALQAMQAGELSVSAGGHFMAGGWALIVLYDYAHGQDFIADGAQLKYRIFDVLHQQNVEGFLKKFGKRDWSQIDFTKFSKTLNSNLKNYDFRLIDNPLVASGGK